MFVICTCMYKPVWTMWLSCFFFWKIGIKLKKKTFQLSLSGIENTIGDRVT